MTKTFRVRVNVKGGAGSGNYGHAGRPGMVGGSGGRGVVPIQRAADFDIDSHARELGITKAEEVHNHGTIIKIYHASGDKGKFARELHNVTKQALRGKVSAVSYSGIDDTYNFQYTSKMPASQAAHAFIATEATGDVYEVIVR